MKKKAKPKLKDTQKKTSDTITKEKVIEKPLQPLVEEVIKKVELKNKKVVKSTLSDQKPFDMKSVKAEINDELRRGKITGHEAQMKEQRAPAEHVADKIPNQRKKRKRVHKNWSARI